jgi:hypothetical protein
MTSTKTKDSQFLAAHCEGHGVEIVSNHPKGPVADLIISKTLICADALKSEVRRHR